MGLGSSLFPVEFRMPLSMKSVSLNPNNDLDAFALSLFGLPKR